MPPSHRLIILFLLLLVPYTTSTLSQPFSSSYDHPFDLLE